MKKKYVSPKCETMQIAASIFCSSIVGGGSGNTGDKAEAEKNYGWDDEL